MADKIVIWMESIGNAHRKPIVFKDKATAKAELARFCEQWDLEEPDFEDLLKGEEWQPMGDFYLRVAEAEIGK